MKYNEDFTKTENYLWNFIVDEKLTYYGDCIKGIRYEYVNGEIRVGLYENSECWGNPEEIVQVCPVEFMVYCTTIPKESEE